MVGGNSTKDSEDFQTLGSSPSVNANECLVKKVISMGAMTARNARDATYSPNSVPQQLGPDGPIVGN